MTAILTICSATVLAATGIGFHDLQLWLERWDYDRHRHD
jgi:hypothetical protein